MRILLVFFSLIPITLTKLSFMYSILARGLVTGCLFFSIISCNEEEKKPEVSPDVNVVLAGKKNISTFSEYVGQVYGLTDVNIDPRVQGWITGIYFKNE